MNDGFHDDQPIPSYDQPIPKCNSQTQRHSSSGFSSVLEMDYIKLKKNFSQYLFPKHQCF